MYVIISRVIMYCIKLGLYIYLILIENMSYEYYDINNINFRFEFNTTDAAF